MCCCCGGKRYEAHTIVNYSFCTFRLINRGTMNWEGVNLASGFQVELTYAKHVILDGSILGLTDDFDLTTPLARFLSYSVHSYSLHGCKRKASTTFPSQCLVSKVVSSLLPTARWKSPVKPPCVKAFRVWTLSRTCPAFQLRSCLLQLSVSA